MVLATNADIGSYYIRLFGNPVGFPSLATTDYFYIYIQPNQAPDIAAYNSVETLTCHHTASLTYYLDSDPEGNNPVFEAEILKDGVI